MLTSSTPLHSGSSVAPGAIAAADALVESNRGFSLAKFWHALVERIWIVVACVLVGLFIALGYLGRTPKTYQAHAVLEVEFQEPTVLPGMDGATRMRSMFLASQEALRTIEQNLTNRALLARVVRAEGLAEDGGRALLGKEAVPVVSQKTATTTPTSSPPQNHGDDDLVTTMTFTPLEDALAGATAGMVKPIVRRGTRLIDLYVANTDPAMAQRLTEAIGREYIRNSIERRATIDQETLRYLLEEEERLKTNLQKSEAAVAEFKEKTPDALQLGGGTAATGSQMGAGAGAGNSRGGIVEDKLQELNSKLTAAKADRLRLEEDMKEIQEMGDDLEKLLNIPSIASATLVIERRHTVTEQEAQIATLALRYKEKHPKMMAAKTALREARESLRQAVMAQPAILKNAIEQAKATEANLKVEIQEQEKSALALNRASIGYQELARQAESDRALYENVLKEIKETDLTKDVKTNAVSVIEHATLPHFPVAPIPSKAITFGLLGGLAIGLGLIFGYDALDRSIKTVDQAEASLGLPVLAAVPETKGKEPKAVRSKVGPDSKTMSPETYRAVEEAPEGPVAEAFRNLRASLSLLGPEVDRKIFLFTSALPNEGKSFTSANYAIALAQQGHRVLLVDGDLRRPSVEKIFSATAVHPAHGHGNGSQFGVVDYLVGEAELKYAARKVLSVETQTFAVPRGQARSSTSGELYLLAGGRRAPNPAELLSGRSFQQLLAEAAEMFDRVVIDSAPVLAVSDTLLMAPYVQTTCLVLRAGKTPRNAASRALALLATAGNRPAGVILNRLPRRRGAGYYYYYASHGYGAGEGAYGDGYTDRSPAAHNADVSSNGAGGAA